MSHDPRAQALAGALSLAAGLARQRMGLQREQAISELRATTLAHLVDALVTKRVDAVQTGFSEILGTYAENARHLLAQQAKYADAELQATDVVQVVRLRSRIQEIDTELSSIRAEARLLYGQMNEVLMAIGSKAPSFSDNINSALSLPHSSNDFT